jgi:hypothetical protein
VTERETFLLGGRAFARAEDTNVKQDLYVTGQILSAGIDGLTLEGGEPKDLFARRLLGALADSGRAMPLLGGLIVPVDAEKWTEKVAAETAEFLGEIHDPAEKALIFILIVDEVMRFFRKGIVYSYELKQHSGKETRSDPRSQTDSAAQEGDTENGRTSSGPSPTGDQTHSIG